MGGSIATARTDSLGLSVPLILMNAPRTCATMGAPVLKLQMASTAFVMLDIKVFDMYIVEIYLFSIKTIIM